jgi:cysteine desulfuration protein SufE
MTIEHLEEAFAFLDDWEDRYRFIMDLGKKLDPMPESERIEANLVHGCQSTVWVSLVPTAGPGGPVVLHADSDSHLVKGLAAMVVTVIGSRTAPEVATFDVESTFDRLGLHTHLSPTRSNGLHGMIRQIKARAAELVAAA